MSGILGLVTRSPEAPDLGPWKSGLEALSVRGPDRQETFACGHAALAVCRADWELGLVPGGGDLVVTDGALTVAADASLYYRQDLLRKLDRLRVAAGGPSPGHLILAAYRAWGDECPAHLEGDFAFILWDGARRRLLAARDFSGRRPLFYSWLGDRILLASSIGAIRAHPASRADLDLVVLAETASAVVGSDRDTCYQSISAVSPGHSLCFELGGGIRTARYWEPPAPRRSTGPADLDQGAEQLRSLLRAAVGERLPGSGPAAISLSGGWDSSAVFAIGQEVIRERGTGALLPVSISYPPGDPGREDEFILASTRRWHQSPHWLEIGSIPVFHQNAEEAARRDEPFVHPFRQWNTALAAAASALGSRVMFDGYGGDQLFGSSNAYLADLVRQGRWRELIRQWRLVAARADLPTQLRWMLLPLLPGWFFPLANAVRGRPVRGHMQQLPARWIRRDFAEKHDLTGRLQRLNPPQGGEVCDREFRHYLTSPFFSAIHARVGSYALAAGVEERSPLYDGRIIEFAATRPREERNRAGDSKRLLRHAVRGLLPDEVLAPRRSKTGTTGRYFMSAVRRDFPGLAQAAFARPLLPELGIVDLGELREAVADLEAGRADSETAAQLFFTLETELWLQSHAGGPALGS